MQTVLVSGGAGYVGSHACLRLAQAGFRPVVYDNLSNGSADFVQWGPLETGDIRDPARLDAVFAAHRPVAVMHFAALIEVGESVRDPGAFYDNNVGGSLCLIQAARRAGVDKLVFSSTCATYGPPTDGQPLREDNPQDPASPYGRSKLMVEQALTDLERHSGFRSIRLRYFNAAGADPQGRIGERHSPETHAVPLAILAAMDPARTFKLFGDDYPTPDGTAVRDYVHVLDLADAHVAALRRLLDGAPGEALNLGRGEGISVRELIAAVAAAGTAPKVEQAPRREGDAPMLVADNARARAVLGWSPKHDLADIVGSAWAWHRAERARVASAAE
ncbi:MAG: UDP-glucose 4-epimerase GalE [Phenylobacterium sp.]|uniref:UDP-glucose 4-epimerase GalE n=1 Tax=Phenylobacterium sp. TaxID=1871053 RepID=UPI002734DD8A|nr:UDP-glucose 4-epimerase GalE [Phenylobacterium sp.]MDP3175133.1 UDP-glucose 4-epimerase GalE [Phenylobacterium sp.]